MLYMCTDEQLIVQNETKAIRMGVDKKMSKDGQPMPSSWV